MKKKYFCFAVLKNVFIFALAKMRIGVIYMLSEIRLLQKASLT